MGEALITALGTVVVAAIAHGLIGRRQAKSIKKSTAEEVERVRNTLLDKIQTNHGLEPYQYLELIGQVDMNVKVLGAKFEGFAMAQATENARAEQQRRDLERRLAYVESMAS